jgi:hypothetical protein
MAEEETPMRRLIAIDPGSELSAFVTLDLGDTLELRVVTDHGKIPNGELLHVLRSLPHGRFRGHDRLVLEWMQPRGMPTSAQEFETALWAGRFLEAAIGQLPVDRITRHRVKIAITGQGRANDANIRAAIVDRYGGAGGKEAAVGRKASMGPLYGIKSDEWAALALALAWADGEPVFVPKESRAEADSSARLVAAQAGTYRAGE